MGEYYDDDEDELPTLPFSPPAERASVESWEEIIPPAFLFDSSSIELEDETPVDDYQLEEVKNSIWPVFPPTPPLPTVVDLVNYELGFVDDFEPVTSIDVLVDDIDNDE